MTIENTIKKLVKEWKKKYNLSPYEINNGYCDEFASQVEKEIPEAYGNECGLEDELFWGHVWIEYQERYYDAECPKGVSELKDLPIFKRRKGNGV